MKKEMFCFLMLIIFLIFLNSYFILAEESVNNPSPSVNEGVIETTATSTITSTTETRTSTDPTTSSSEQSVPTTSTTTNAASSTETSSTTTETADASISTSENLEKLKTEFKEEELEINTGITPDSNFYFIEDKILSRFRDDLENRERKVGEIRAMINKGDMESARISLKRYKEYAESLEKEVDPEKREEARRSAAAIYSALKEIENELPKENKEEFIEGILDKEKIIVTAAEIANKIKVLCEQLAELDPGEYSRACMIKEDTPKWQKKLNQRLTKEQEKEAKEFGEIMSECFKTSGNECRCKDISFYDFSVACTKIAPLASACDKGDENACEEMESISMPELPSHLQNIFDEIESKYKGAQMDLHMPKECIRADARDKESCMLVMFQLNAPDECVEALKEGKIKPSNEKEARKACEEIMFKENAPEECIEAGIRDPKECGKFMFKENAPEECIEAGLTGESRSDEKKCREIMESNREEFDSGDKGTERRGGAPGSRCMQIQNSQDRLICFEEAVGRMGEDYGIGDKYKGAEGKITPECRENRIHEPSDCERFMREEFPKLEKQRQEDRERRNEKYREREREIFQPGEMKCPDGICDDFEKNNPYACPEDCGGERREGDLGSYSAGKENYNDIKMRERECAESCSQRGGRWDFTNGNCQCFVEERQEQPREQQPLQPPIDQQPIQPTQTQESPQPEPAAPQPEPAPSLEPVPAPEPAPVTGGVINVDNKFLDYWFER